MSDNHTINPAEEWPDGTFGGTRPDTNWTPAEQAAHRADLEAALRTPTA